MNLFDSALAACKPYDGRHRTKARGIPLERVENSRERDARASARAFYVLRSASSFSRPADGQTKTKAVRGGRALPDSQTDDDHEVQIETTPLA